MMPQYLAKYGLIPEFIGRVPITVSLDLLDEEALVSILTQPKNALVKQYQKLFEMDGVGLSFSDDAVTAIAEKAVQRKTGARGLRSIMEGMMTEIMYEIPSDEDIAEVEITKDVVENQAKPRVERNPEKRQERWLEFQQNKEDNVKERKQLKKRG